VDQWNRMPRSDQLIAVGSLVVLVGLFLPWFGYDVNVGGFSASDSADGFHSWGILTLIALLAVIALYVVRNFAAEAVKLPELPVEDGVAYLGLAGVELLGVLLFWVDYHGKGVSFSGVSYGIRFGWIIALIGVVATGAGGYLKRTEPAAASGGGSSTWQTSPPSAPYGAPPPPAAPPPPPAPPSSSGPPGSPPPPPYNPPPPPGPGG